MEKETKKKEEEERERKEKEETLKREEDMVKNLGKNYYLSLLGVPQ
jgi:hypothetical protein